MAFYRSEIINITRYKNATFVKLTASASGFVSYDFEPEDGSGTFTPEEITIRATYGGNLHFGKWEYSRDGETWEELMDGKGEVIVAASGLTVPASSSLFSLTNSAITFRCTADDGESADTYTLTREVDPLQVYRKSSAGISNLADKISLIATDEELKRFTTAETFYSKYAEFSATMGEFRQNVTGTYATKKYADDAADAAEASAKNYIDRNYVQADVYNTQIQQTDAAISAQAAAIQGLAGDVAVKATVFSQGTAPASGMTDGDLWVDTANNNEVYRYQSTGENPGWKPVVNASAIVSQINQTAEQIQINANKINLNGLVTANENFKILTDGSIEAKNASMSGIINIGTGGGVNGEIRLYSGGTRFGYISNVGISFVNEGRITTRDAMPEEGSDSVKRDYYATMSKGCIQIYADYSAQTQIVGDTVYGMMLVPKLSSANHECGADIIYRYAGGLSINRANDLKKYWSRKNWDSTYSSAEIVHFSTEAEVSNHQPDIKVNGRTRFGHEITANGNVMHKAGYALYYWHVGPLVFVQGQVEVTCSNTSGDVKDYLPVATVDTKMPAQVRLSNAGRTRLTTDIAKLWAYIDDSGWLRLTGNVGGKCENKAVYVWGSYITNQYAYSNIYIKS